MTSQQPPTGYQIRVRGHLGAAMQRAFPALRARAQGRDTLLNGIADQAALHGVLAQIEGLGLQLLEVRRLQAAREPGIDNDNEHLSEARFPMNHSTAARATPTRMSTAADDHNEELRVAVLGTGIMGSAMARGLVAAGLSTTVWDRSPSVTAPLAEAGAKVASSPARAVADASVVITMLPTTEVVSAVIFGAGVAEGFARGAVWAQMGTIGVTGTTETARRLRGLRPDVLFVDAPVSGSKGPAEAGQLLILASGPAAAEPVLRPAFSVIGRKTVWLGEAGQGSRLKLIVNAYMSILIEGVAEALELASLLGIPAAELAEAIAGGPLDAPIADAKLHRMEQADFAPEFPLEWALKDVDLALEAARGGPLPLLTALSGQWRAAVTAGHGREDVSAARLALGRDQ